MNAKIQTKIKNIALYSFLLIAVIGGVFGCAIFEKVPVERQAVISYEAMSLVLNTAKPTLKVFCENETLNAEDCEAAREAYNSGVDIYKSLGDVVIGVMDTGNGSLYQSTAINLMDMITTRMASGTLMDVSTLIPLAAELIVLGLQVADISENFKSIPPDKLVIMKVAIETARDSVTHWTD